ncbi:MAG: response regulator [Cyanobacteria bacterium REEB65]|nr:response regulator [Cyanobacteria bacterium REEB65]
MGKRIVIADPSAPLRRNLSTMLESEDYECSAVADGIEALSEAFYGRPDLILIDPEIDGISGAKLCEALRTDNLTALIPVIFISARLTPELLQGALEAGAIDYMQKPLEPKILLPRIRRYIAEQYIPDQQVSIVVDGSVTAHAARVIRADDSAVVLERPAFPAAEATQWIAGALLEINHVASDRAVYRRRGVLTQIQEGDPDELEISLASGIYRSTRRQSFRRDVNLPARYKMAGGFFRVATILDVGGGGFRISGLHESLEVGTEVQVEFKIPSGPISLAGKIAWRKSPPGEPISAGIQAFDSGDPSWRLELMRFLFADFVRPVVAVSASP